MNKYRIVTKHKNAEWYWDYTRLARDEEEAKRLVLPELFSDEEIHKVELLQRGVCDHELTSGMCAT